MSEFNQFPSYQTLEEGSKGEAGKANRSIPDRIKMYNLMDYVKEGHKVLDLGCNRGFFGTALSPHIGSYVGLDSDINQIKHAQVKSNMELRCGPYEMLSEKFQIILCLSFHSYVGYPMEEFAYHLDFMLSEEGTLFIEGHPKGYRGEPEKYFDPLMEHLTEKFCVIESKMVPDRALMRPFRILKRMAGMVSKCIRVGDKIHKEYFPDQGIYEGRGIKNHLTKEIYALRYLLKEKHVPTIISAVGDVIVMDYCGEPLRADNLPDDWKKQCEEIDEMQKRHETYHNDYFLKNVTVKDGIIYLIDWGLYSINAKDFRPLQSIIDFEDSSTHA